MAFLLQESPRPVAVMRQPRRLRRSCPRPQRLVRAWQGARSSRGGEGAQGASSSGGGGDGAQGASSSGGGDRAAGSSGGDDCISRRLLPVQLSSLLAALFGAWCATAPPPAAGEVATDPAKSVLQVGPGTPLPRISDALRDAPAGATLRVAAGVYREKLLIERPVAIESGAQAGEPVVLLWESDSPYEAAVTVAGGAGRVALTGLVLKHRSPSVANNYALYNQGASLELRGCAVSSASGSALGCEGGSLVAANCSFGSCARHGMALFGDPLTGSMGSALVDGCDIRGNKGHGVLARDGVALTLAGTSVTDNKGYGLWLADCDASVKSSVIQRNGGGSVLLGAGAALDVAAVLRDNKVVPPPRDA